MSNVVPNVPSQQPINHPQIQPQAPAATAGMYQAQNIQQRYYDQYENYARPNPNNTQQNYTNNNHQQMTSHGGSNNGYYNNGQAATTTHQQQQQYHTSAGYAQQNYHNTAQNYAQQQQQPYYAGNAAYPTGNGYSHHQNHLLESNNVGGGQKITDYDPLNDGSRNAHHRSGGKKMLFLVLPSNIHTTKPKPPTYTRYMLSFFL